MKARMAGILSSKKTLITKSGKMMAFVDLEDMYGPVEVVVFPNVYEKSAHLLADDAIIGVSGTVNFKEGEMPKLLAENVVDMRLLEEMEKKPDAASAGKSQAQTAKSVEADQIKPDGIVKIRIPQEQSGSVPAVMEKLKAVMVRHEGRYQSIVYLPGGGSVRTTPDLWVNPDEDFRRIIISIVGEENYKG